MQEYLASEDGHMAFLLSALDSEIAGVGDPVLSDLPGDIDPKICQKALNFINRRHLTIEPRKQWPVGHGAIDPKMMANTGRSLTQWGDPGLAESVSSGKYEDGSFSEELVDASISLITNWGPKPFPHWVTCVPSLRRPTLVPDFAQRLATRLSIPFSPALIRIQNAPEQKTMANSSHQAINARDSLRINQADVNKGPVFLVDDIVDSRWTSAVCAALLRSRGSGEVFPFFLATAGDSDRTGYRTDKGVLAVDCAPAATSHQFKRPNT